MAITKTDGRNVAFKFKACRMSERSFIGDSREIVTRESSGRQAGLCRI